MLGLEVRGRTGDLRSQPLRAECSWPRQGRLALRVSIARAPRAVLRESEKLEFAESWWLEPGEILGSQVPEWRKRLPYPLVLPLSGGKV